MTTYNTGSPVPSVDVRDLYDNAENLDNFSNGQLDAYADRLGVSRKSLAGMRTEFNAFLAASGFETTVLTYTDGVPLQVDRPTQLLERASAPGTLYSIKLPSSFPVVLSGTWATDEALLVVRVDQSLRQDLADDTDPLLGAGLSGFDPALGYPDATVGNSLALVSSATVVANLSVGLTDYSAELNTFAATLTGGKTGRILPGVYPCESAVTFPKDAKLIADGVALDFSAAAVAGNFPNSRCVEFAGGSLTELANPSVAPAVGTYTLTFAAPPAVASDDVLLIWNDTPGSWSNFRPEYTAGEAVVVRALSGSDVLINSPLLQSYTTAVRVFKMAPTRPKCTGLEVRLPTALTVSGVYTTLSRNAEFHGVKAANTGIAGITLDRSVGFTVTACETTSDRSVLVGNNYGLSVSNCQWGLVMGGRYEARRHAISMGGSSLDGSIPTRFIKVQGVHMSSWDSACADMHGNVEFSTYDNCTMQNGVTISGNNNAVRNSTIYAPVNATTADVAISINECKGTSFAFENLKIIALGDPVSTGRAVIDCGGNSTNAMTVDTVLGGVMSFRNIDMSASNANNPIKITNRGSTAANREIHIQMNCPDSPATRVLNGQVSVVSGNPFARVTYDIKFPNNGAPATTPLNATRISGMKESGTTAIVTTATAFQDVAVVFNRAFPKAPSVRVQGNQSAVGNNVVYAPIAVTLTGFTARIYTTTGSMSAGINVNLMWSAELEE